MRFLGVNYAVCYLYQFLLLVAFFFFNVCVLKFGIMSSCSAGCFCESYKCIPTEGYTFASSRWPWDAVTPDHFKVNSSAWGFPANINNVNLFPHADKFHIHLSVTSGQIIFTLPFYWDYNPWSFPLWGLGETPVPISQLTQAECLGSVPCRAIVNPVCFQDWQTLSEQLHLQHQLPLWCCLLVIFLTFRSAQL